MKKLTALTGMVFCLALPVFAADDPIAAREALMESNGASAAVAGAMMKGELPYNPAVGKAVIVAMHATAQSFGAFFPEGSQPNSDASPKIWEDRAGFDAELAKFQTAASAADKASGKSGPADIDAFKAAIMPVMATCKSCHEGYRLKD